MCGNGDGPRGNRGPFASSSRDVSSPLVFGSPYSFDGVTYVTRRAIPRGVLGETLRAPFFAAVFFDFATIFLAAMTPSL